MTTTVPWRPPLAPIEPHVLYPLEDLHGRTGLGKTAFRTARRQGLKVKYVGNRAYVMGRDFIAWVDENARDEK